MAAVGRVGSKQSCLIVLPACKEGVSAQSFINCFTLSHSAFTVQLATPGGKTPEFHYTDEHNRRWLSDFRPKAFAVPISLDVIDPNRYAYLVIPHAPGAAVDLADDKDLGQILNNFVQEKKLVCAIGTGVAALMSAKNEDSGQWSFKGYSLTGSTVFELARTSELATVPIIPEDGVKDNGGVFSAAREESLHVVVNRNLVTGQNENSTLIAMQNLLLLANQKQGKGPKQTN